MSKCLIKEKKFKTIQKHIDGKNDNVIEKDKHLALDEHRNESYNNFNIMYGLWRLDWFHVE